MSAAGRFQLALLALIGTAGVASAQLSQLSQQTPPAAQDGKVRVFVYRDMGVTSKEFRPSIFVDEMDVARLQSGRSVILAFARSSSSPSPTIPGARPFATSASQSSPNRPSKKRSRSAPSVPRSIS